GFNGRSFPLVYSVAGRLFGRSKRDLDRGWVSEDGGASWHAEPAEVPPGGALAQDPRDPGRLFLATLSPEGAPVVMRSDDGGATWRREGRGLDSGLRPRVIAVDPSKPERLWLAGQRERPGPGRTPLLWRSEDGAVSWEAVAVVEPWEQAVR